MGHELWLIEMREYRATRLRDEQLQKEAASKAEHVHFAVDVISLGSTCLLLKGGMTSVCLGTSILSLKLLSMVREVDHNYPSGGTGFKAAICLFFSGAAYCFDSRSMERSGGIILLFIQVMAL